MIFSPSVKGLIREHKKRRPVIKARLKEFEPLHKGDDGRIFEELCFCLFTPQAKATSCDSAVRDLKACGLLFNGCVRALRSRLKGKVRFHNKKAGYLVGARKKMLGGNKGAKCHIDPNDNFRTREWLVANIKGLGYKEASHFLRNIGLGRGLAILDVHILKNLKKYGVIRKVPPSVTKKNYLAIEERMRGFSGRSGIPLEELDLLFWSLETGYVFK